MAKKKSRKSSAGKGKATGKHAGASRSSKSTAAGSAAGATAHTAGAGKKPKFDNLKIGYDNNADDDINDAGDDLVMNDDFGGTSETVSYDHAGNLIDDGTFRYVYDAWNRLIKVQASEDDAAVTIQTAEYDAKGRRMKKVVTNSGDSDGTVVYLYDGWKICETRDGSGNMVQQFIHGTRFIDELVMARVADKGDLYIHQDANWNVIAVTDLGGHLVERYAYTPYGDLTVHQDTSFGDRDGDGDVDSTDKGTVGVDCTGTVSGACRINDLDFDGDYDSSDGTLFDSLTQGVARHPALASTGIDQPFGHQGLLFEPEIASYQNRHRQYAPAQRRFPQRDPLGSGVVTLRRLDSPGAPGSHSSYSNDCQSWCALHDTGCNLLCANGEFSCQLCAIIALTCTQDCLEASESLTETTAEQLSDWISTYVGGHGVLSSLNQFSYLNSSPSNRLDPSGLCSFNYRTCHGHDPAEIDEQGGCGEPVFPLNLVPDPPQFHECCVEHDKCYSCCACPQPSHRKCEKCFGSCMHGNCGFNPACHIAASIMNLATRMFGVFVYDPRC